MSAATQMTAKMWWRQRCMWWRRWQR